MSTKGENKRSTTRHSLGFKHGYGETPMKRDTMKSARRLWGCGKRASS